MFYCSILKLEKVGLPLIINTYKTITINVSDHFNGLARPGGQVAAVISIKQRVGWTPSEHNDTVSVLYCLSTLFNDKRIVYY